MSSNFIEHISAQSDSPTTKEILRELKKNVASFRDKKQVKKLPEQKTDREDLEIEEAVERDKRKDEEKGVDAISVTNAGIVLTNPFLNSLFVHLGLMKGKEFISENSAIKAVGVLNFIATGNTELNENESALLKVLCGLEPSTVIPFSFDLSEKDKEEAINLLSSLIGYWKALGNTSADGLRSTFIQRNGLLKKEAGHYLLVVERSAADVLMSYKPPPWTIGLISFDWMKKMLRVDWIS